LEDSINKSITFDSILSLMAFIVKLNPHHSPHCLRVAEQEIQMLTVDLILMCLLLLAFRNEEQIG